MPWLVLAALIALLAIVVLHRRLPFPYGDLFTVALCLVAIPWGLASGEAFVLLLLPALGAEILGVRIPMLNNGGGRRRAVDESAELVSEPARYASGPLESRWPRGRLEVDDSHVRFVDGDGDELFRFPRGQVSRVSGVTIGRGDLRIDTTTQGGFLLSLGKRGVSLGAAHAAARFWQRTIET